MSTRPDSVNIGPYVQTVQKNGYIPGQAPIADPATFSPTNATEQAFGPIKPEVHGLFAVTGNPIVAIAFQLGHQEQALRAVREGIPQVDRPFTVLANTISGYFEHVALQHFGPWLDPEVVSPERSVYEGYDDMIHQMQAHGSSIDREGFFNLFLAAGKTGIEYVRAIHEVIPERFKAEGKPQDPAIMVVVANNHYPTVREIAGGTNDEFVNLCEDLVRDEAWQFRREFRELPKFQNGVPFSVNKFHLEGEDVETKLQYNSSIYDLFRSDAAPKPGTPRVGCSALYGVGIAKLYEWFSEFTPQIYTQIAQAA